VSSPETIRVFAAGEGDRELWERFVGAHAQAEVGHRWEFHEAIRGLFALPVFRLAAARGERWMGILPLALQKSLAGRFLTSVPYLNHAGVLGTDPEARTALGDEARRLAETLRADRLEIRGRDGSDLPLALWDGKSQFVLELPGSAAALWDRLGAKLRSQVKRPGREGFTARVVEAPALADGRRHFYPLLARRWHELGSPVLPETFFAAMEGAFPADVDYVVVERQGLAAAAAVLLRRNDEIEIPWAASSSEHDRVGVNMLLYWRALERAVERGARRFDFGRSTPGSGNARFKTQWGAVEAPLRWNVVARRAGRGRATERGAAGRGLVAAAWRLLPGFVAGRLGPVLAARIPY
jgi:FemAB-related protein (PEP-CTERM system-associated)